MKKLLAILAVVAALLSVYFIGCSAGAHHAVCDAEMWLLEMPEEDTVTIHIELDGQWYERSAWIG